MSAEYIGQVLAVLQSSPTSAELDYLVTAHANIGYIAAQAEAAAEEAEAQRKYDEAEATASVREAAMTKAEKLTAADVAAKVTLLTWESKKAEIKAAERAHKVKNLLSSVTEAINAIKFLGRYDSAVNMPNRLPKS